MTRDQRGSVLPLAALLVVVLGGAVLLVGRLGVAAADRTRARMAADAAALAGAADGDGAARGVADANRAGVASVSIQGTDARVEVEVGAARAVARARRSHGALGGRTGVGDDRLAPAMRAALGRAEQLLGEEVPLAQVHQPGLAVEVPAAVVERLAGVAPSAGLCRPDADTRPTRFEVCQAGEGEP
ncbi:MAG TPA: pilus assembly protein TadG-related protein [Acidimicrobiales bacterium]